MLECKNICQRLPETRTCSWYYLGHKWCRNCKVTYEKFGGNRCPCCSAILRTKSRKHNSDYAKMQQMFLARKNEKRICERCGTATPEIRQKSRYSYPLWRRKSAFFPKSEGWICGTCGSHMYSLLRLSREEEKQKMADMYRQIIRARYDVAFLEHVLSMGNTPTSCIAATTP